MTFSDAANNAVTNMVQCCDVQCCDENGITDVRGNIVRFVFEEGGAGPVAASEQRGAEIGAHRRPDAKELPEAQSIQVELDRLGRAKTLHEQGGVRAMFGITQ